MEGRATPGAIGGGFDIGEEIPTLTGGSSGEEIPQRMGGKVGDGMNDGDDFVGLGSKLGIQPDLMGSASGAGGDIVR